MHISRIQVEEGFLGGLDLRFREGLNVIIGARGTGKTSIIELLRFALEAKNHTPDSGSASLSHARSILEGGEVTVTVADDLDDVVVSRTGEQPEATRASATTKPIVFSQKEIESIGLTEKGRLSLLDGFVVDRSESRRQEERLINGIKSLQREIENRVTDMESLAGGLDGLAGLKAQLASALLRQGEMQGQSAEIATKQGRLAELTAQQSTLSVREGAQARFVQLIDKWTASLQAAASNGGPERWTQETPDPLYDVRNRFSSAVATVLAATAELELLRTETLERISKVVASRIALESDSRSLRSELNSATEGAGAVARDVSVIQTQIAQLESIQTVVADQSSAITQQRLARNEMLVQLDKAREARFLARQTAAKLINKELNPRISVRVDRYAHYNEYVRAIVEALRGSNMKYNDLSQSITVALSPRELVDIVESADFEMLSASASIPRERAARVISALKDSGLSDIATCDIEDGVSFTLLDGAEQKDISNLSAGQRCTVILPIVLQHNRTIIIDQPEDHIDNAFIADTLIKALIHRAAHSQIIVSTHNANIPVLGNASLVVEMVSDGRHGSVQVAAPLENPDAVHAITTVMEGGAAAFQNRAKFYNEHHL